MSSLKDTLNQCVRDAAAAALAGIGVDFASVDVLAPQAVAFVREWRPSYAALVAALDGASEVEHERDELARQRGELAARVIEVTRERDESLKLIREHNTACVTACQLMHIRGACEAYPSRGRRCPDCPANDAIDLPASLGSDL